MARPRSELAGLGDPGVSIVLHPSPELQVIFKPLSTIFDVFSTTVLVESVDMRKKEKKNQPIFLHLDLTLTQ